MEGFTTKEQTQNKDDFKTRAAHLKDHVSEYVKTYARIVKAKATRGASNAVAGIVIAVFAFFFAMFFLVFTFTGIALWLGSLWGSPALGFFCMGGFFLFLVILVFALRRKVIIPMIRNLIISKVYE